MIATRDDIIVAPLQQLIDLLTWGFAVKVDPAQPIEEVRADALRRWDAELVK